MTPLETGGIVRDAMTFADEPGEEPYLHDETIWCDDTPDAKQQMAVYRRELGLRVRPARKSRMRRLSYGWLAGWREITIDPVRCPLTFAEFTLKEYAKDCDGAWIDEIPDGNDFWFNPELNAYYEVLPFDKLVRDSRMRNQAFFRELGIQQFRGKC